MKHFLDNLISIGEVKVNWIYDTFENDSIKTAYFDFYVPEVLEDKYGMCYANRFTILEDGKVMYSEVIESYDFSFELVNVLDDVYEVNILKDKIFVNKEQYNKLCSIYNAECNKYKK